MVYDFEKKTAEALLTTAFIEFDPSLSPDAKWLLYSSDESDRTQIYARPYPDINSGKWQISIDGGAQPMWSVDGSEIFFRNGNQMMAATIDSSGLFRADPPTELFKGDFYNDDYNSREFDLEYPEGNRFLMVRELDTEDSTKIIHVENWLHRLTQPDRPPPRP
jgi:hypothetical protein